MNLFAARKAEYEGLLKYAAQRYSVPGVLDFDDVYQLSQTILLNFVTEQPPEILNSPEDFRKLFKTALFHDLINEVNKTKAQCRDWRRQVSSTGSTSDGEEFSLLDLLPSGDADPEACYEQVESQERANEFFLALANRLSDDGKLLLLELVNPRDVPAELRAQYKRAPMSQTSTWLLSQYLGWPCPKVTRELKKLRDTSWDLMSERA